MGLAKKKDDRIRRAFDILIGKEMKVKDKHFMSGRITKMELYGPDGVLKELREFPEDEHNTITVAGDKITADAMSDRGETLPSHMGVGTTSGGKNTASNALEAQVNPRVALDSTTQGAGADDNDVIWVCTFAAGVGTGALVEAGLHNHLSAGDMYAYQEFAAINKGAADGLVITWTCTYGAS